MSRWTATLVAVMTAGLVAGPAALVGAPGAHSAVGECPPGWEPVGPVDPNDPDFPPFTDQNVNVFVGGDFSVGGGAAEAEGVVVALGSATFAKDTGGTYNVGVVGAGSGVPPAPGTDMLVVGGDVGGNATTILDVGSGIGGDIVAGGTVDPGLQVETNGGTVSEGVADATAPYDRLPALIADRSATWAALAPTGTVELTGFSATFTGDGTSDPQVFSVDGASLGTASRSLQFVDIPAGVPIYVNLTGDVASLDFNALLGADGTILDPFTSEEFVDVTTRLLWNVPTADDVTIGGLAQLPGSIVVADPASSTTVSAPGTNGRVWVTGDLLHTGVGAEMHNYPFLPDEELACKPLVETGGISVQKVLDDPDGVVDPAREFTGTVACTLDGDDVTPADDSWSVTAGGAPEVVATELPEGTVCTLSEDDLVLPPDEGYEWGPVTITPASVTVEANDVLGFTVTNVVEVAPTEPPSPTEPPTTTDPPDPTGSASPSGTFVPVPTAVEGGMSGATERSLLPLLVALAMLAITGAVLVRPGCYARRH